MSGDEYSKFRPLYCSGLDGKIARSEDFYRALDNKKNRFLKEILVKKQLHASSFNKFNDTLEFVFGYRRSEINREQLQEIFDIKNDLKICSFSKKFRSNDSRERLMWAHYAGGDRGIRIDFELDGEYEIYDVKYENKAKILNSLDDFSRNAIAILTTKMKPWAYERECRTITHDTDKIKIKIKQIVIGRAFLRLGFDYYETNKFDDNIIKFARKIKRLVGDDVKVLTYASRYLNELIVIEN